MHTQFNPLAAGWHLPVWIALLVAASVAFSLGFACATPFAAFAAIAALTMSRRNALLLVCLVWFANQAIGFGVLHYPLTTDCFAWGVGLSFVAFMATLGAEWTAKRLISFGRLAWAMAFLASFVIYEGLLLFASMIAQSGTEDYTMTIAGRVFAINVIAFIGLLAANRIGVSSGLVLEPRRQLVATGKRS